MIKGIKWYFVKIYFGNYARGPEESLEAHVIDLVKRFKIVSATFLKEDFHFSVFGTPASTQLFGSRPGSKPIIMELFISEVKLDPFIGELEALAMKGKSNIFYFKQEVSSIVGNPSVLDKIDEYKKPE